MALCQILYHPHLTAEKIEQVFAHLRTTGPVPPEGNRVMISGPAESGRRVISVWDSKEARDRFFAERLAAAYDEVGLSLDDSEVTLFEVETLVAGDLTGAPQPA